MPGEEIFLTAAEFAIAIAGFTSVVVVFVQRGSEWTPVDSIRVRGALWGSLGAAFFALVPSGLDLLGLSGQILWRVSSGLFAAYVAIPRVGSRDTLRSGDEETRQTLEASGRFVLVLLGFGTLLVHVANAIGLGFEPQAGVYFLGLFLYLVMAATMFVRIIFLRPGSSA